MYSQAVLSARSRLPELPAARRARCSGFSAWELATVAAIVAILVALATPDFRHLRASASVATEADRLLAALAFARSRAILTGKPLVVCLSADLENCVAHGADAATAWIVFENTHGEFAPERDPDEPVLRAHRLDRVTEVRATRSAVTYWPAPRAAATSTFEFCSGIAGARPRAVIVSQTGRPRLRVGQPGETSVRCSGV